MPLKTKSIGLTGVSSLIVPNSPLSILRRDPSAPLGPFLVRFQDLAKPVQKREGISEEALLLADLIIDTYLECQQQ